MYYATRAHEIQCGHRVYGHFGKCKQLHGHSYIFKLTFASKILNATGMSIDFYDIKNTICKWLDDNWDHRLIIWEEDPIFVALQAIDSTVVSIPYNPTAEQLAKYLVEIAPSLLNGAGVLSKVEIQETSKCTAGYEI